METVKLSKSDKLVSKINELVLKKKSIKEEYKKTEYSLNSLSKKKAEAYKVIELAKKLYQDIQKDEILLEKRRQNIRKDNEKTKDNIRCLDLELKITTYEEEDSNALKKEKKGLKRGQKLEPILDKIALLPDEIIRIIRDFMPYEVKNALLESKTHIFPLLNTLHEKCLHIFLINMCMDKTILTLMSQDEAAQQIRVLGGSRNPTYNPYWRCKSKKEMKYKIKNIINIAKEINPKFAYELLSTFHILIDPKKKYRVKYNYNVGFIDLIEEDLPVY